MQLRICNLCLAVGLIGACVPASAAEDRAAQPNADAKQAEAEKTTRDDQEPPPEQLAKQLEFDWQSISIQASRSPKDAGAKASRSLSISGQVKIVEELDVLALSQQPEVTEAIDENGNDLVVAANPPPQVGLVARAVGAIAARPAMRVANQQRYFQFPHRMPQQPPWFGSLSPMGMNVNLNLNQRDEMPSKLTKVRGTLAVLAGKTQPPVDIALHAGDEWNELSPDLSIRLTKADVDGSSIQYQLESKGDDVVRNFHGWLGPNQALPKTIITKVAFIDEFNQEHEIHTGGPFNPNTSGSASFGNTGRLRTMRFAAAKDLREVEIPFEIKDIDVPSLGQKAKKQ